jgi:dTDP-glucose 4,6-dehydratase
MTDTILVTGGAGFIGSSIIREALGRGHKVVNLDALTYAGGEDNLSDVADHDGYIFIRGSILDNALVAKIFKDHMPGALINAAAETHVDRSIDDAAAFIETNINGTYNLLHQSLFYVSSIGGDFAEQFRYLQVSTDEVYGSILEGAFVETDPYRPNSPYAASKAAADHLVRAYCKTYGLKTVITHGSNTYGPRQFPEKLIPLMIQNALEGKKLPVYGDGKNVRDWLYVTDHANGILDAALKGAPGESYNIGGGFELENITLVNQIIDILDQLKPLSDGSSYRDLISYVADRPGHDFRYALDTSKANAGFSWQPVEPFTNGLKQTVDWYLKNQDWTARRRKDVHDGSRQGLGNTIIREDQS